MTRLLLIRHGETTDNARKIMQGQTQGQLDDEGFRQAGRLAEELRGMPIDAFVASDLHRAVQTAGILAQLHGKEVYTTPLLRERDWGDFTGRYIPDLQGLPFPENVEPMDCLMQRAQRFLDEMAERYPGQCVAAVGHGIINKAIQAVYYKKNIRDIARMDNCEVRELFIGRP
ncbi:MAG: histidine phosphatase family protein [Prevotella sp.]